MQETRFNVISETGDGAGFAIRLNDEGHSVRLWMRDPEAASIADNMVEKVGDLGDLLHDAHPDRDVFLFDVTGNGVIADYLVNSGFAVLGGSMLSDRLERSRDYGYSVMESCGIDIPETHSFTDFEDAIAFADTSPAVRWVYKPSKQLGDLSPSHVSFDSGDLKEFLASIQQETNLAKPEFELQAFEKGIALSTELWFQNGQLIDSLTNHTLERKELMNDDIGPSGGCTGNVTWFCNGCRACDVAKRLVPWCEAQRYHGCLDLNVIVTPGRIFGLEFTPRFGYDATPTLLFELVRGSTGAFFGALARGQLSEPDLRDGFAGAIRVSIPPWPTEKFKAEEGVPIRGLDDREEEDLYWYNVKRDSRGNIVTAGGWGIVALVTGRSADPRAALRRPLQLLESLKLKHKQYRTDLHQAFAKDLEKLEEANVEINVSAAS